MPTATSPEILLKKIADAKKIIWEACQRYPVTSLALAWTGGKDSTLVLHLVQLACAERNLPMPRCFCIDEGDMFEEIRTFIATHRIRYGVDVDFIHNHDVSAHVAGGKLGGMVKVKDLNEANRREIERLGYEEDEFAYEPESFVGNHLMKTAALNQHLLEKKSQAFFEGIRWDEQGARHAETFFSPRRQTSCSPAHMRVCPILAFTERDVWDAHFQLGIPICDLYRRGFRSLGARVTTQKLTDTPAWEQDLENTSERGGRRQDKEGLMKKLRDLGYM